MSNALTRRNNCYCRTVSFPYFIIPGVREFLGEFHIFSGRCYYEYTQILSHFLLFIVVISVMVLMSLFELLVIERI